MHNQNIRGRIPARRCTRCEELKPLADFRTIARRLGEKKKPAVCRGCSALPLQPLKQKRKRGESPEARVRKRERNRLYRESRTEEQKALDRENRRRWARDNKEKLRFKRKGNAEKLSKQQKEWRKKNPERVRELFDRRRALISNAEGSHTFDEVRQMYEDQGGLCAYCEAPLLGSYHVDHIEALSKGGSDDWMNLAVVCAPCNLSKGTKTVEEFMEYNLMRRP